MQWPTDLLRTLHSFAGPWPLATAIARAYDHMAENWAHGEIVKFALAGYDTRMNHLGWSLFLEVEFKFYTVSNKEQSKLSLRTLVERDDWSGDATWKSEFVFWSLDALLKFLPRLDEILPKGCYIINPLEVVIYEEDFYIYYDYEWAERLDLFSQTNFADLLTHLYSPSTSLYLF